MAFKGLILEPENILFDATYPVRWLHRQTLGLAADRSPRFEDFWFQWSAVASPRLHDQQLPLRAVLNEFLLAAGVRGAAARELAWASVSQFNRHYGNLRPLPGVVRVANRLCSMGIQLAVAGNSLLESGQLAEWLGRWEISVRWDQVMTSTSAGRALPCADWLAGVCERWRIAPHEAAYVSRRSDAAAAVQSMAMHGAVLGHAGGAHEGLSRIDQFHDLVDLVDESKVRRVAG